VANVAYANTMQERPWPDIGILLEMLRKHHDTVRVIRLVISRPRQVLAFPVLGPFSLPDLLVAVVTPQVQSSLKQNHWNSLAYLAP
jgi:hypothetical protein